MTCQLLSFRPYGWIGSQLYQSNSIIRSWEQRRLAFLASREKHNLEEIFAQSTSFLALIWWILAQYHKLSSVLNICCTSSRLPLSHASIQHKDAETLTSRFHSTRCLPLQKGCLPNHRLIRFLYSYIYQLNWLSSFKKALDNIAKKVLQLLGILEGLDAR